MLRGVVVILVGIAGWHGSRLPQAAAAPPTAGALALMDARDRASDHLDACISALPLTPTGRVSTPQQPQLERIAEEIQARLERDFNQWVWSVVVLRTRYRHDQTLIAGVDYGLAIRDNCNQHIIPEDCATYGGALSLFRSLDNNVRLNGLLAFTPTEPISNLSPSAAASAAAFAARVSREFNDCVGDLQDQMTGANLSWLSNCLLSRLNTTQRTTAARSSAIFEIKNGGVGAAEGYMVKWTTLFRVQGNNYSKNSRVTVVVQPPLSW